MTALQGMLVLIKVGDGQSTETFYTIGGLRTSKLIINNKIVETTNRESGQWRSLLNNSGLSFVTISGSGIFTDLASEEMVRARAFTGNINNYQFIFANGDCLFGPFKIATYERNGNHDAEESYSLTLESAGNLTYTGI